MTFRLELALNAADRDGADTEKPAALQPIARVSTLVRQVVFAHRAGATRVHICGSDSHIAAARAHLEKEHRVADIPLVYGESLPDADDVVRVPAELLLSKGHWKLLAEARDGGHLPGFPEARREGANVDQPLAESPLAEPDYAMWVRTKADARAAKRVIFANLRKGSSRFVARHIYTRISVPTSKLLAELPITPNQITIGHFTLGVIGCVLMAFGTVPMLALGAVLLQLSAAFDLCDGEIARSKLLESDGGQYLDSVCDHITHVVTVCAFTIGYSRYAHSIGASYADLILPIGLGTTATLGALVVFLFWYAKAKQLGGVLTAVAKQNDDNEMGFFMRTLHFIRPLGERDQFTMAITAVAVIPALLGSDLGYPILFWVTQVFIVLASIYFPVGAFQSAQREAAG
ncbi:MAG: CDP-alcohol phosphatidyltransferase family protein [Deltaproteobacteria bacterium]|nr:CDP-alcohol phosphatidyltransferase family protein [Deltaproteobacteria bacterium]